MNNTHTVFSQGKAVELATQLTAEDEDGWTYVPNFNPQPDGPKTAIIKIYDENGDYVGLL